MPRRNRVSIKERDEILWPFRAMGGALLAGNVPPETIMFALRLGEAVIAELRAGDFYRLVGRWGLSDDEISVMQARIDKGDKT